MQFTADREFEAMGDGAGVPAAHDLGDECADLAVSWHDGKRQMLDRRVESRSLGLVLADTPLMYRQVGDVHGKDI